VARSLRLARSTAFGAISAVLLAGAGDSMADAAQAQGDAARGRTLFVSKGCVVCHALNEVGGTSAPPLDPEAAPGDVDARDFVARMWRGAEAMIFMQQQDLGVQIDFRSGARRHHRLGPRSKGAAEVLGGGLSGDARARNA
jgi:Cytochrome c